MLEARFYVNIRRTGNEYDQNKLNRPPYKLRGAEKDQQKLREILLSYKEKVLMRKCQYLGDVVGVKKLQMVLMEGKVDGTKRRRTVTDNMDGQHQKVDREKI